MISIRHLRLLKPFIPRRLQIAFRRALINWQLPSCRRVWPIDPNTATPPENWKGWPEGKKFAVVLTHDVDTRKGNRNCRLLAEIDERMGFRSSFNFVAEDYQIDPELLNDLSRRGFEIGQHGIHHTDIFRTRIHFREQAVKINHYLKKWQAVGFRGPSMFHNLDWIGDLDIEYDSSTFDTDPFEPQPDGAGTIFPFWVPGNAGQKGYVELPYTLPQDFLLFVLMGMKNIDVWKAKLRWVAENGGMALLITHPDYMNFSNGELGLEEYPSKHYEEFLTHLKTEYGNQYWPVLPKDLARWWSENQGRAEKRVHRMPGRRKTIWIDLENSPHVPFFKPIIGELKKRGHEVVTTARDCFQVCGLADLMGVEYKKVGRHYGKHLLLKGAGLVIRSLELVPPILKRKPDIAVSHGSRSQVATAAALGIPSIVIIDYEYVQTIVKPTYTAVPEMLSDDDMKGCYRKSLFKYPGIKEDVYVPDFRPDPSILKELGIRDGELVVTVRPPATEAHYYVPESGQLFEATVNFLGQQENIRMVMLPRNEKKQTAWIKDQWSEWCGSGKIVFPEHVVDGLNLIWHSDLVISGGGTMNREAAALGVPVYSIFRGTIGAVDRYLSENGRLVLLESVEDVRTKIALEKRNPSGQPENVNRKALDAIVEIIETSLRETQ